VKEEVMAKKEVCEVLSLSTSKPPNINHDRKE
jgi:hypothetical protein